VNGVDESLQLRLPADEQTEWARGLVSRLQRFLKEGRADEVVDVPGAGQRAEGHGDHYQAGGQVGIIRLMYKLIRL
jgi:hypothetical protein